MISVTARERNLINKIMLSDPATHPVILLYNKLPCINHFQPPSRPSCQWKPNFKQRFYKIHSIHTVLQLVRQDLITGLLVLWGQIYGIQCLVKNAWDLQNWPRFRECNPNPTPLHEYAKFLGCDPTPLPPPTTLIKPASLHEFTQVWDMWCTSSPTPLFMDRHTVYEFLLGPTFEKNGCALLLWVRPCLHYIMHWNPMGAKQIIS